MLNQVCTFFGHSRHVLSVDQLDVPLDILAFEGAEALSEMFRYSIELTSTDKGICRIFPASWTCRWGVKRTRWCFRCWITCSAS